MDSILNYLYQNILLCIDIREGKRRNTLDLVNLPLTFACHNAPKTQIWTVHSCKILHKNMKQYQNKMKRRYKDQIKKGKKEQYRLTFLTWYERAFPVE